MRWISFLSICVLVLAACGEPRNPSILDPLPEEKDPPGEDDPPIVSQDIYDGSPGASTDNPFFFFLPPIVSSPTYSGVAEGDLEPVVSICPLTSWSVEAEACDPGSEVARFLSGSPDPAERVMETPGVGYRAVWDTGRDAARPGSVYRVSVSVIGQLIGYVDVLAFQGPDSCEQGNLRQRECETRPYDPSRGYAAFWHQGTLDIAFRIEEGAIESEYCDPSGLEDCDVEIFSYETGGCLRVFENPGQSGETLGSQACFPGGAAELDGEPVEGSFAVILTLEKDGVFQGDETGYGQVPFFPDLRTDPPGISVAEGSGGISVVICQAAEGQGALPEDLHPSLRPFLFFENGDVSLPQEYAFGSPECEGYGDHGHAVASHPGSSDGPGLFGKIAAGVSRISRSLLPQPLNARRLHGGLNTTVYDTRGKRDSETEDDDERTPSFSPGEPDGVETGAFVVELGAILDVDPSASNAAVSLRGDVGAETTVLISALNALDDPFPFEIPVEVEISGANPGTVKAQFLSLGQYTAAYTPANPGTDEFTVRIDGKDLPKTLSSTVHPVPASAALTAFTLFPSIVGSPTRIAVSVADQNGDPYSHGKDFPISVEVRVTENATGNPVETIVAVDGNGSGAFDGVYEATFTPTTHGTYDIRVFVNGEATPGSPEGFVTSALPVDPEKSSVRATEGLVDSPTTVFVDVFNTAGGVYDYGDFQPINVQVTVTGANPTAFSATDLDLDGTYTGTYTPSLPGTDIISVSIDGVAVPGTLSSDVAPVTGTLLVQVSITGAAPAAGLPVEVYRTGGSVPLSRQVTDQSGTVSFQNLDLGEYAVHLPGRDFDVRFPSMTEPVAHDGSSTRVTFLGATQAIPEGVVVWRIREGGSGNAFAFRAGTQSWGSASSAATGEALLGVPGHLATFRSLEENGLITTLFLVSPDFCPEVVRAADCRTLGWVGLSDEVAEGQFRWVTGEDFGFARWAGGRIPPDPQGIQDFVQSDASGFWTLGDPPAPPQGSGTGPGLTATIGPKNGGYFVEWEVELPAIPGG